MSEIFVTDDQKEYQRRAADKVRAHFAALGKTPLVYAETYGCQQNEADTEALLGLAAECGYAATDTAENADLVLVNTCAIREHAELKVFSKTGGLKKIKEKNPDMIVMLCGCMAQEPHVGEKIKKSYPYVNLVFGTFAVHRLPELMYKTLCGGKRVFDTDASSAPVAEGLPVHRDSGFKAWLPIMYGCNNFCSYCVVPYVRGRERSRRCEDVLNEAREIIASGVKEITLLGQNVNSYGKNGDDGVDFAELLRRINALPGDFKIRFMTSHPKDCNERLLDAMAECEKCAHHLHLPFQSGNDRVLKEMNRGYTREHYLELIAYAKRVMPDISLTSDVIVGFPGETYEEFLDTVSLIREVEFTSLFTFIFSPREGTRAASMEDPVPAKEKSRWFSELLKAQEEIASKRCAESVGRVFRVLVENEAEKADGILTGRTDGNVTIDLPGEASLIGSYADVTVTSARNWTLTGELAKKTDNKK